MIFQHTCVVTFTTILNLILSFYFVFCNGKICKTKVSIRERRSEFLANFLWVHQKKLYLIITRSYAVFLNIFIYLDWIVNCCTMTLDSLKFLNPRISTPFLVKFPLLKYTSIHVLHSLRWFISNHSTPTMSSGTRRVIHRVSKAKILESESWEVNDRGNV